MDRNNCTTQYANSAGFFHLPAINAGLAPLPAAKSTHYAKIRASLNNIGY